MRLLVQALRRHGLAVHTEAPYRLRTFFVLFLAVYHFGRPDVVHLQWQHPVFVASTFPSAFIKTCAFFGQWAILRFFGVRFVWTVHNVVNHHGRFVRWELTVARLWARMVDGIIVHCDTARTIVADAYRITPARITVVPHGTFSAHYTAPHRTQTELRTELELPVGAHVFLFFGLIRAYKGVETLIATFQKMAASGRELVIVGRPEPLQLAWELQQQSNNNEHIRFVFEYVTDDRLPHYICAADVVVLPYVDILTSGAVNLAGAFSRPVIVPRRGCFLDLPEGGCIKYDPGHKDGLESALVAALTAPLVDMGRILHEFVEQHTWEEVGAQTAAVYERVTSYKADTHAPNPNHASH
jgi:beta-1,4-mannosyltransferase